MLIDRDGIWTTVTKMDTLTHCGPRESHHHSRWSIFIKSVGREYRLTNKISEVVTGDVDSVILSFHELVRCFTEYLQHIINGSSIKDVCSEGGEGLAQMWSNVDKGGVGSDCMRTSATLLGTKASRAGIQQCTQIVIIHYSDGSGCTKQTALVPQP